MLLAHPLRPKHSHFDQQMVRHSPLNTPLGQVLSG